MNANQAIEKLRGLQSSGRALNGVTTSDPAFTKWYRDTEIAIERIFGQGSRHSRDFGDVSFSLGIITSRTQPHEWVEACNSGLKKADAILQSMIGEIEEYGLGDTVVEGPSDHLALIERLCLRFHLAARELRQRHGGRPPFLIEDEYDLQDLVHAMLRLHFDDIRDEEWTPSYAGRASRVDFLLKDEETVIEVKKSRPNLRAKEIGEQLIIDRDRYQAHPNCKTLICFVYDPDRLIQNPRGLERDLERYGGTLRVKVVIAAS